MLLFVSYCITKLVKFQKMDGGEVEVCSRSGAPPILQQNACNCLASIMASHSNFTCKEKMKVSRPAVLGHPPSAPPQSAKIFTVGGGVMWKWCAPNSATKCMQLLGEHHCITFQLHMQRKDASFKACRFWAPAECTLTVSQHFHSGGGVRLNLVRLKKSAYRCSRRLVEEPLP